MLTRILSSLFKTTKYKSDFEFTKEELMDIDPFYEANQVIYDLPSEEQLPRIINEARNKYRGQKLCNLHSKNFQSIPSNDELNISNRNVLIKNIDEGLLLIEPLVIYEKECWKSFAIKSIPIIENGIKVFQGLSDPQRIIDLSELIEFIPELDFYKDQVLEAKKFCSLVPGLIKFIEEKEGITVKDLKDLFTDDEVETIKSNIYYLFKYGVLKKRKEGRYNFYELNE